MAIEKVFLYAMSIEKGPAYTLPDSYTMKPHFLYKSVQQLISLMKVQHKVARVEFSTCPPTTQTSTIVNRPTYDLKFTQEKSCTNFTLFQSVVKFKLLNFLKKHELNF